MKNIKLTELFKEILGKVRTWTIQYGWDSNDIQY